MYRNRIIDKFKPVIALLPEQTQIAVTITKGEHSSFAGLIKNDGIAEIDNSDFSFEIGSVTKAVTGHVLAQLATENKLDLDAPIDNFLPYTLYNAPVITLKQLALHTSGLPRMPHDYETQDNYDPQDPFKNYTEEQLEIYLTQNLRMDSEPGTKHQYSNFGFGLLSYIISRIEGQPFTDVVAQRIFRPLGMIHSTFNAHEVTSTMVQGIDEQGNKAPYWEGGLLNGCLGIISTANDLPQFAALSMDSSNAATRLQVKETFFMEPNVHSNMGWGQRLIVPENILMQGINGGTGGFGASMLMNSQKKVSVAVLSNIWPWRYMEVAYPIARQLLVEVAGE